MLVLMRGTSCSGKGTYCANNFKEASVLSSDKFRVMLAGSLNCQKYNKRVFEMIHECVKTRIENRVPLTVVDATHMSIKDIRFYLDLQKLWKFRIAVISIKPPSIDELIRRRDQRIGGAMVPDDKLKLMIERYESCKPSFLKEMDQNDLFAFIEV